MPVLHQKASGDYAKLCKAKPFIEMPCVGVGPHDGIELENPEAVGLSLGQAVQHQLFADMEAAGIPAYGVAGVADMAAAADVVGMENIEAEDAAAFRILSHGAVCLFREKCGAGLFIQQLGLWKCDAVLHDFIPDFIHGGYILFCIGAYLYIGYLYIHSVSILSAGQGKAARFWLFPV